MTDQPGQPVPEVPESELIRVRREKLARIVALGYDAFPTKADTDTTIAAVIAESGEKSGEELEREGRHVRIAGRVMAVREFGKTAFLVLSERTARIQVYCRKDTLPEREWELYRNLDTFPRPNGIPAWPTTTRDCRTSASEPRFKSSSSSRLLWGRLSMNHARRSTNAEAVFTFTRPLDTVVNMSRSALV